MFGVSLPELILIFAVVLLVLGPERLPKVARSFGKMMGQLRRSTQSLRREFYNAVYAPSDEVRSELAETSKELRTLGREAFGETELHPLCPDTPQKKHEDDCPDCAAAAGEVKQPDSTENVTSNKTDEQ